MISEGAISLLVPILLALLEDTLKKVSPSFAEAVTQFLPSSSTLADILRQPNPETIKAQLLEEQFKAIEALVDYQLAKG